LGTASLRRGLGSLLETCLQFVFGFQETRALLDRCHLAFGLEAQRDGQSPAPLPRGSLPPRRIVTIGDMVSWVRAQFATSTPHGRRARKLASLEPSADRSVRQAPPIWPPPTPGLASPDELRRPEGPRLTRTPRPPKGSRARRGASYSIPHFSEARRAAFLRTHGYRVSASPCSEERGGFRHRSRGDM
jgi:hypothetical protein